MMGRASRLFRAVGLGFGLVGTTGCGVFAMQQDHDATVARVAQLERYTHDELLRLRADVDATRDRLDNALRANADTGTDLLSEKARLNELSGRIDEADHKLEEMQSSVAASRNEVDARLDQLARAQAAQSAQQPAPAPPALVIPPTKSEHYAALQAALKAKDYATARVLGHEYVNRYATDEKADDALYWTGQADIEDGRPSSAVGEWNRLLKNFPRSNMLDKTLFGMGQAYEVMHDCSNAKLAYGALLSHFPHDKLAPDARARVAAVNALPADSCAPP
jgi:TolA-binding protein